MDPDPLPALLNLVLVLVLVLLNGFFVAAEFALVKIRSSRLDTLVQEGNWKAKVARSIVGNLNAYLSACQLGITLASLALGWVGEPTLARLLEGPLASIGIPEAGIHTIAFIIGFTVITAFHITIGEQVPKTYAIRKSEDVALWVALPLLIFYKMMMPFIWALNGASNWMLRRSGIEPDGEHESLHTEDEIRVLVQESHNNGLMDKSDFTLLDNVFEFGETHAREIMIPRTEMNCLYADKTFEENKELAIQEMQTRYPVCDPDKDNIIGFVHIKDILKVQDQAVDIRSLIRPLTTVPESIPIDALLRMMQRKKTQMVLLIDEYGGTSGLVTVEDILEEIVGEIQDEFDEERPVVETLCEGRYSVDGLLLIEEANDQLGLSIETEDYDTLGGWLYSQVEIPPSKNHKVQYGDHEFTIDEVDHLRISRIVIQKMVADEEEQEQVAS